MNARCDFSRTGRTVLLIIGLMLSSLVACSNTVQVSGPLPTLVIVPQNNGAKGTLAKLPRIKDACGSADNKDESVGLPSFNEPGSVTIDGSSALLPLVRATKDDYTSRTNNLVTIEADGGGSGTGLTDVKNQTKQIGMSDIFSCEKFKDDPTFVDHRVAVIGVAMVVNPEVAANFGGLTKAQMKDIWTGKLKNWKEVGGPDLPIVLVERPPTSGTATTWRNIVLDQEKEASTTIPPNDDSSAVKDLVATTKGATGYLAFSYFDTTVLPLSLDGVAPTTKNVASGKYPVWAYEHMYTNGPATGALKDYLAYLLSYEVQTGKLKEIGFIPISEMTVER